MNSRARDLSESVADEIEKCGRENLVAHIPIEVALGRHVCEFYKTI
jgi:hypothetical protein